MAEPTDRAEAEATGLSVPEALRTPEPAGGAATGGKPREPSAEEKALTEKRSALVEGIAGRYESLAELRRRLAFAPTEPRPPLPRYVQPPAAPQDTFRGFPAMAPGLIFAAIAGSKISGGNAMAVMNAMTGYMNGFQEGDQLRMAQNKTNYENSLKTFRERNKLEKDRYDDLLTNRGLSERDRQQKLQLLSHALEDETVAAKMRIGDVDGAIKTIHDREKSNDAFENKLQVAQIRGRTPPTQRHLLDKLEQDFIKANGREPTAPELLELQRQVTDATHVKPQQRPMAPLNEEIKRRTQENIQNGMEPAEAFRDANQTVKRDAAVPPASQITQMQNRADMIANSQDYLNKAETLLNNRPGLAGIAGKLRRPVESLSNIAGMSGTDARQFERYINELQEWAPRIMTYSTARPLAADAAKINSIVAGLQIGDTTKNTLRQFAELRALYDRMHKQTMGQIGGTWTPQEVPTPPPAAGRGGGSPIGTQKKRPAYEEAPVAE